MATALNTIVLDLGTTSIKAAVCSDKQLFDRVFSLPAPKISINKGQYTSDAVAYLAVVETLLKKCQRYCSTQPLLGLCYQRSSFLIWNNDNGLPVTPLISWQDTRGESTCKALQKHNLYIKQLSGLPLTAYYFAPKVRVLLKQQPELLQGLLNNKLRIGTLDSFLIWHWSASQYYLTDASMAARTLLMDINKGEWSNPLSELFDIPLQVLAKIHPSTGFNLELQNGTILTTSLADQSAALLASILKDDSEVLVNLGTGGFVIRNKPMQSNNKLDNYLNTLVYQQCDQTNFMAIEGTLNSITTALKPYPVDSCKIENLAEFNDIFCLAEPSGMGAPYFRADIGLRFSKKTEQLSKQQIACLLLEGIIFRVALILEEFNQQHKISGVYLAGGLSALPCLQQGIALCSPAPTFKLSQHHSSLLGVALLTNNLSAASFRESEVVLTSNKYHGLIEKYQHWKVWFSHIITSS